MRVIVGLGNPGIEYALTRHNIGWMVLDRLCGRYSAGNASLKFEGMVWGPLFIKGEKCLLLKPLTFMNLSGRSVAQVCHYYQILPEETLVISDDAALPFGQLRLRTKGSAGGHNGLASVLGALRTLGVPRLRVGVGAAPTERDMVSWVIGTFLPEERSLLPDVIEKAADAVELWLMEEIQTAMSQINIRDKTGSGES
ncbi:MULTISPECIES: aminoacyl-tRNA hydrolase [Aminobacterium]|uniref:aminoacyl-tRNA hydrolase n=1 Tax=Aminobacterium TaxID=81466 RepID=UPI00257EC0CB|nr:aminoacyl-tRNA hydrolase [Aminobacterium sp. UBA4987]